MSVEAPLVDELDYSHPKRELDSAIDQCSKRLSEMQHIFSDVLNIEKVSPSGLHKSDREKVLELFNKGTDSVNFKFVALIDQAKGMIKDLERNDFCIKDMSIHENPIELVVTNKYRLLSLGAACIVSLLALVGLLVKNGSFNIQCHVDLRTIMGPADKLMPWYLQFITNLASSCLDLFLFGPPNVAQKSKKKVPSNSHCAILKAALAGGVIFLLQLLSLGTFVYNLLSLQGDCLSTIVLSAKNSPTVLSWILQSWQSCLAIYAASPFLNDHFKMTALWNLVRYNMKFVRIHDSRFSHWILAKNNILNWPIIRMDNLSHPGTATPSRRICPRPVISLFEWLLHPQGLMAASGSIIFVQYAFLMAWHIPITGSWFLAFGGIVAMVSYFWVAPLVLHLWYLFLDNVLMLLLKYVLFDKELDQNCNHDSIEHLIYDCVVKFKTDPHEKANIMKMIRKPEAKCDWLLNLGRGSVLVPFGPGSFFPRFVWWCKEGKLTNIEAYDQDVQWFQATGITYHSWCFFLTMGILIPPMVSLIITTQIRFVSDDFSFLGYFRAFWETISERHWYTYRDALSQNIETFAGELDTYGNPSVVYDIVRRFF